MKKMVILFLALLLMGVTCEEQHEPSSEQIQSGIEQELAAKLEPSGTDLGDIYLGSSQIYYVSFTNHSPEPVRNLRIDELQPPFSFEGGAFPGTTGNCTAELLAHAACNIALAVAIPSTVGPLRSSLMAQFELSGQTLKKEIPIRGQVADLALMTISNLDFGLVEVDRAHMGQLVLSNLSTQETARNIQFVSQAASKFQIVNPASCNQVLPNSTCYVDVKYTPSTTAYIDEVLDISYELAGKTLSERVTMSATAQEADRIEITGQDFASMPIAVPINQNGRVTFTVKKGAGGAPASHWNLVLAGSGLKLKKKQSTCLTKTLHMNDSCVFVVATQNPLKADLPIARNLRATYKLNGLDREVSFTINGRFVVSALDIAGQSFGTLAQPKGAMFQIKMLVSNPLGSGVHASNLKLVGPGGAAISVATAAQGSTCQGSALNPGGSCYFVMEEKATKSNPTFSKNIKLVYFAHGSPVELPVKVVGNLQVTGKRQKLEVAGADFGKLSVARGTSRRITLMITNPLGGSIASANHFRVISGLSGDLTLDLNASTCLALGKVLTPNTTCNVVFDAAPKANNNNFSRKLTLGYTETGVAKRKILEIELKGSFEVIAHQELIVSGIDFGTKTILQGNAVPITVTVTNPAGGSISLASNFKLVMPYSEALALDRAASTCLLLATNLKPHNESCNFVFNAAPDRTRMNYVKDLTVDYTDTDRGVQTKRQFQFRLNGNLQVLPNTTSSGFLAVTGQKFGPTAFTQGTSFEVTLTVSNTSPNVGDVAKSLGIERRYGNTFMNWNADFFVQPNPAKSTCTKALVLNPGRSCLFVLKVGPTRTDRIDAPFAVTFKDSSGVDKEMIFSLDGSYTMVPTPAIPVPDQAGNPPRVFTSTANTADGYFKYTLRPSKVGSGNTALYPTWVWDLIPFTAFGNKVINHVPWSFQSSQGRAMKLMEIVPDRIDDGGKMYVKLYHGTTSDTLEIFKKGANAIKFDLAANTALGMGFYLSADPEESKAYACDRLGQRKRDPGAPPNLHAILIVVGVEAIQDIKGVYAVQGLSDAEGKATRTDTYFGRNNNGMYNQFVFFSDVQRHLKIFEIVELGANFYMADSISDGDGHSIKSNYRGSICGR